MNFSPLSVFISQQDRMLYKQHAVLIVRNLPLLLAAMILLFAICTLMFANAMTWQRHLGFGVSTILISAIALIITPYTSRSMQQSPEHTVFWFLFFGIPILIWWGMYYYILLQSNNLIYMQQFILVLSLFVVIAIATVGRFSRIFVFIIGLFIFTVTPATLLSHMEGAEFLALQQLVIVLAELFFLRTLNEQVSKLFLVEGKNNELLAALQQKNTALEQANVSQSRYLSAASHDLRQPLHALALLANDAQRKNTVPEIDTTLQKMELAIDSLSQSFNAMLNLSRLDAGVVKPQFKRFPIQRLLQRLAIEYTDVAAEKNLRFHIHPSDFWVLSDEDMLYSIMSNFVSNAIRYTQSGGVLIGTRRSQNEEFKLVIYDTGSGVPSEKAQQIFQEYQRLAEAEQRVKGGVGLGLAISERMARLLGAKLWIKSALGQGSAFGLIINRTQALLEPQVQSPIVQDILAGKRVAIIDDDEVALESLEGLLSNWEMDVSIALSSDMLLELVQDEGDFDFIISDYHLGLADETGLDILRKALHSGSKKPVCLLLTGDTRTELAQEAQAAGVHLWYKPIRPARLRAYLNGLAQASNPTQV